ncbi:uncharacterized protein N7515_000801 [Penicillium bovifimosum]|uniref:Uncharacterized protein n=1 Tax=Penicillium bovifimosum TaxID=126998 RepID=A0A9W9HIW5_9EURO|nr:uncharacterized protein N7515_000801 [Penicillium bovifimosum]KAJ5146237.1 hypothetical protein N7515_000801 [Penicillium bovifimosum]
MADARQFNNTVSLRLNRVFLSANPLNIEVFRNIASHDKFRHKVNAIIWDEARLHRGPARSAEINEGHELLSDEDEPDDNREWAAEYHPEYREDIIERHNYEEGDLCPRWFKNACEETLHVLKRREDRGVDRPDHTARKEQVLAQPLMGELWQHYQRLLRQQKDVLACQSDLEAFAFDVKQFPALKRVTITPAAHGNLITPLYETPMIRAFPAGFNYSIPRGWLYPRALGGSPTAYAWNQYPELRDRYRGFRTAMRVLANEPNFVSELVMTANSVPTGINCAICDEPCEEYNHFATVLKNPGFRHLDIALLVSGQIEEDFESIVPVEQWSKLRHFELSGFVISQKDCVSFLKTLPKSVRSIELSLLHFLDESWYSMLEEIRRMVSESTLWGDRDAGSRPKITIGVPIVQGSPTYGHGIWVEKEVEDFIYGEGGNPFEERYFPSEIHLGLGVMRDALGPDFERPHDRWIL